MILRRLLPPVVDNRFDGHPAAVWLFAPLALMNLALGLVHILRADGGAQSVSHMPLHAYPDGAAQNIVGLMARMGLEQCLLGVVYLLVLLRYRALIPADVRPDGAALRRRKSGGGHETAGAGLRVRRGQHASAGRGAGGLRLRAGPRPARRARRPG